MTTANFYDQLAPFYHLLFYGGFEAAIERHGKALDAVIRQHWGERIDTIQDISCGIGTQTLGLAQRGYNMTASDLSAAAIARAKTEAARRGLEIAFSVADMRQAFDEHGQQFDIILAADNSVPHLLSDDDILLAFKQVYNGCRPGGGCIISVRDYENEDRTSPQVRPYGLRVEQGVRYLIFQVWEFDGPIYEISMYVVEDDGTSAPKTHVMRTHYYAVGTGRLMALMEQAGFESVQKLEKAYFQPLLIGKKR